MIGYINEAAAAEYLYFQKHFCPVCGKEMEKIKVTRMVNSKSEEAKYYIFSSVAGFGMEGDVWFITNDFFCTNCTFQIPYKDKIVIDRKRERHVKKRKLLQAVKYLNNLDPLKAYSLYKAKSKKECPVCGKVMWLTYDRKIISSDAPEAKDYDFTVDGVSIVGNIEFRHVYYLCTKKKCHTHMEISE